MSYPVAPFVRLGQAFDVALIAAALFVGQLGHRVGDRAQQLCVGIAGRDRFEQRRHLLAQRVVGGIRVRVGAEHLQMPQGIDDLTQRMLLVLEELLIGDRLLDQRFVQLLQPGRHAVGHVRRVGDHGHQLVGQGLALFPFAREQVFQ